MTTQEFQREAAYAVTMSHVKGLLNKGLVTPEEYREMNIRMKAKYQPVSDGLIFESDLLSSGIRANMGAGKEV